MISSFKYSKKMIISFLAIVIIIGAGMSLNTIKGTVPNKTVTMHGIDVADFSDDKILVGAAHNVFVGKVEKITGNEKLDEYTPQTQFDVKVLENIKGNLNGDVTVCQVGGYDREILYLFEGETLIEEGKTYIFSTRINDEKNWHYVISEYGKVEIDNEEMKNVNNSKRFNEIKNAYKDEIHLKADIKSSNVRNSYRQLHK